MSDTLTSDPAEAAAAAPEYPMERAAGCPFAPPPQMLEMNETTPLLRVRIWDGSTPGWSPAMRRLARCLRTRANAVEELMRFLSIIQTGQRRVALEIGGETIKAGEGVILDLAPANWDPAIFANPGKLDLTRDASGQLGFGYGRDQCIGQQLARAEMQIVFPAVLRRILDMKLAIPFDEVPFQHDRLAYDVDELPVTW